MHDQIWCMGTPVAGDPGSSMEDKIAYMAQFDKAQMAEILKRLGSCSGHAHRHDMLVLPPITCVPERVLTYGATSMCVSTSGIMRKGWFISSRSHVTGMPSVHLSSMAICACTGALT